MKFVRPPRSTVLIVMCASLILLLAGSAMGQMNQATLPGMAVEAGEEQTAARVGWIELSGPLRDGPLPFAWVADADGGDSLAGVLSRIQFAGEDDQCLGLVVFLDQPELTMTQSTEIASAIQSVRELGKTVMVFAEVYDLRGYLIACAADTILLQHRGSVELSGIAVEEMYLAGMLEKVGVKPDLVQIGQYKGADEAMMRTEPSPAWNENFEGLLDQLYLATIEPMIAARGLDREEFEALMRDSWTLSDEQLVQRRAVDQIVPRDLLEVTEQFFGDEFEWDTQLGAAEASLDFDNPFAIFSLLLEEQQVSTDRPTLAVIHAQGPINSGDSSFGDGMFTDESIGSRTLVAALEEALLDDNVQGVVLRLDSPGGSALASEVIWQSVRELREAKPVYAAVGSMAASGGYYIVCAADQIYVQPHSILGSIGVVGGKMTFGGLYNWAGVHVVRRSRGPGADLFNSVESFSEEQRKTVRQAMVMVYEQFLDRVQIGRGEKIADLDAVAQGRLFAGQSAIDRGLADQIGGLDQAISDLADQIGLADGSYDVVNLPAPMSLGEYLSGMFGVSSPASVSALPGHTPSSTAITTIKQLMGPAAWRSVSRSLSGMMMLRQEHTLLLPPAAIVIH